MKTIGFTHPAKGKKAKPIGFISFVLTRPVFPHLHPFRVFTHSI
jgi:hypothetical protein